MTPVPIKQSSIVWEFRPVQRSIDEGPRIDIGDARWCREGHPASPMFRCLRMKSAKDHPSFAGCSLDDRRRPIGIFAHDCPPTCKLRAVLPVMFERRRIDTGYRYSSLVNA